MYHPASDCWHSSLCFRVEFFTPGLIFFQSTCVVSKCDAVPSGWILFLLFECTGVTGRRGRNAHNRVSQKQRCGGESPPFLETCIDFRVVLFFSVVICYCFFFFAHAVAVSLSARPPAFPGWLGGGGCDFWPAVEGRIETAICRVDIFWSFVGIFLAFSLSFLFLCSLYRSGGGSGRLIERILPPLKVSFIFVNQNGFYCFHWSVCGCTFF